ncbi:macro domain protein [Bacillus phage vB_BsuS_PJN02]|uniref:Macro domain protein n=1 Tax=Bacillus phage vB_BsuS_PJN02 TaxID=2920374 RepID=A0AC61TTG0_9CAUD|nr:phosphatase [Bacillus phage vB_BsuS_PJN02]UNH58496.1 macro domain protein [Bacillus phage vB_BsuS_PJN02]
MIHIVEGDLLKAEENIIAHQVNCQGVMGSGVALQIKKKYYKAFLAYEKYCANFAYGNYREELLGGVQHVPVGELKFISNLFGQLNYGRDGMQYTSTEALYKCFKRLRRFAERNNLSVAMPYMIGCYRGGADWKEVKNLLLKAFDGYEVTLYKLNKG